MTRREGLLLLLAGAAAFVAALSLRVAALPGEIHDPRHAEGFERAREAMPLLGAVRVRSGIDGAAVRLDAARGRAIDRVLDPSGAGAEFRWLRYLYATPEEIRAARASLERGAYPGPPPPVQDLSRFFRTPQGPYTCDAVPRTEGALAVIREVLPGAELSGEPVRRERERRDAEGISRSLVLGLVAASLALWFTRGRAEAVRGLLCAMLALATLCVVGWGIDRWTLPALLLLALAPRGGLLLLGAPCILSPALALKRIGLVMLFGLLKGGGGGRGGGAFPLLRRTVVAAGALAAAIVLHHAPARLPEGDGQVVRFVPREARHAVAGELRALHGLDVVYEDATLVPPAPDAATRRDIDKIFQLASHLARAATPGEAARWEEIAEAASKSDPFLPSLLRERLVTRDGRAALWVGGGSLPDGDEYVGPQLSRLRGEKGLSHDARLAGLAALAIAAVWVASAEGRGWFARLLVAGAGIAAGAAILLGYPGGEPLLPLVSVAAVAGTWTYPLALLCSALPAPLPALPSVAAMLVAVALGKLSRR